MFNYLVKMSCGINKYNENFILQAERQIDENDLIGMYMADEPPVEFDNDDDFVKAVIKYSYWEMLYDEDEINLPVKTFEEMS